jgi:acetolactate synthase-1/2/3 large subunit
MDGGDRIAAVLKEHGVRFLFTLCGGHISPILVGSRRQGIRVVDVRHEATALFAADAVARMSGTPGVAAVTAGPGVTNLITALKNAQLAQSPVVVLGGATATALRGRGALQDIDQSALVGPHVKWSAKARRVHDLAPLLQRALTVAREGVPGPVFMETPVDLLYPEKVVRDWYGANTKGSTSLSGRLLEFYLGRHVNKLFADRGGTPRTGSMDVSPPQPDPRKIIQVARQVESAERPVMLIGSQAMLNPLEADQLAIAVENLGVPVYLSGMARGLMGPKHPLHMRHQRRQALKESDLVVLAGVPCDFRLNYGRHIPRQSRLVAANRSRRDLRLNRRPNIGLLCDAGLFVRSLADELRRDAAPWSAWSDRLAQRDAERDQEIECQSAQEIEGLNPLRVCREVDSQLDDDSVLVADGGDFVATASYVIRPRRPVSWLDPGVFGTLGVGAGFALGAKLCRPESEVWVLYGDGSLGYSIAEFDTFVRHSIPIIAVVGNDACWMQIARDQVEILGDDVGCPLLPADYHKVVEGFGAVGLWVTATDRLRETILQAKHASREGHPVLVNALIGRTDFRKGSISI